MQWRKEGYLKSVEVMGLDVDGWSEVASRCLELVCVVCSCGLGSAGAVFYLHLVFPVKQNCTKAHTTFTWEQSYVFKTRFIAAPLSSFFYSLDQ